MEYQELITSAIHSLKNNLMRTSLTMLGIIIGISSVILIFSIGQGAVAFITEELSSFGTNYFSINPGQNQFTSAFSGGIRSLTIEDAEAIKKDTSLTNIQSVAPMAAATVIVSANDIDKSLLIYGMTPDAYDILKPDILYGELISSEHDLEAERVAVIGADAVETFFGNNADPVGEKIKIDNKTFRIIGVTKSASILFGGFLDNSIYIPLDVALNEIEGQVDIAEIDISVKNTNLLEQTIEEVKLILRDRHNLRPEDEDDFSITSAQDALSIVQNITNLLTLLISTISGISLIVGGVGVMNIMLVSVTERTREIGLLKSIGAMEKDILIQFLIESVVMSLIGGIAGILLGISGAYIISLIVGLPFVLSLPAIIIAVGVSMLVGIIFGLYPAHRAAKLSPIEALRYE